MNLKTQDVFNAMRDHSKCRARRGQIPNNLHAASIRDMHEDAIRRRQRNRELNYNTHDGYNAWTEEGLEMDKAIEREISILGQVFNPRISAKSYRALNHTI